MRSLVRTVSRLVYRNCVKPLFFRMSPDDAHDLVLGIMTKSQRFWVVRKIIQAMWAGPKKSSAVRDICGVKFSNPIGIAAGFDKNAVTLPFLNSIGCGFVTAGSVTLRLRPGNEKPWFHRLPESGSIIVHAGLPNKGINEVARNIKNNRDNIGSMVTILSVAVVAQSAGHTTESAIDDAIEVMERISRDELADMAEVNISCPNANDDQPFTQPGMLEKLLKAIDKLEYPLPVFMKMPSKSWEKFEKLIDIILKHNVQGVSIANLTTSRGIDLKDTIPDGVHGGLSGQPCFERSNELIEKTRKKCGKRLYIIGIGGVMSAGDAQVKIDAGADLVALISGLIFEGPQLIGEAAHKVR